MFLAALYDGEAFSVDRFSGGGRVSAPLSVGFQGPVLLPRVSDHVAILDQGRLVRAAPTAALLASFTQDRIRVVIGGADDDVAIQLASLDGVVSVEPAERDGDLRAYFLKIQPESAAAVQRAVMRFAADNDYTLTENGVVRLDLEDAFFRLIDTKERAA